MVKNPPTNARDTGSIPGEGNGNPLQYSCLENPMDRGAWQATVHGVSKSRTRLSAHTHTCWSRVDPNPMPSALIRRENRDVETFRYREKMEQRERDAAASQESPAATRIRDGGVGWTPSQSLQRELTLPSILISDLWPPEWGENTVLWPWPSTPALNCPLSPSFVVLFVTATGNQHNTC